MNIFNDFVRNQVLPQCTGSNGPRLVLVLDNAKAHKSLELVQVRIIAISSIITLLIKIHRCVKMPMLNLLGCLHIYPISIL